VVADLSFISLRTVAPALLAVAAPGADLVLLVKPQFEAGRAAVSAGRGVIRDPEVRAGALTDVGVRLQSLGASIMGAMVSPLRGADGNVEFLLHAVAPGGAGGSSPPATDPATRAEALDELGALARSTEP
jgi:23S rRNA (cytidine1920-2'-O)/16S rRNA (cytidine1409-2'-O)-methyltransferase